MHSVRNAWIFLSISCGVHMHPKGGYRVPYTPAWVERFTLMSAARIPTVQTAPLCIVASCSPQVDAQNNRLTEIFYRARRADLRLPERPRVPLRIEEDDSA